MKQFQSNALTVTEMGGYWYAKGQEAATNDDRSAVIRQIADALTSISPEALRLARALAVAQVVKTPDVASAKRALSAGEHDQAYRYAVRSQGFTGTYQDWLALADDERAEYEAGAAGIPTA